MKFIMKFNGSVKGKSGRRYHVNTGQEVEAAEGEFNESVATAVVEEVEKPKKRVIERASKGSGEKAVK